MFTITKELGNGLGRVGYIDTYNGTIQTPAFIVVGTKATVKTLSPEQIEGINAQGLLANAYHLYLQPGADIVEKAGGLHNFMNWKRPTFTDSGGFQVMSLGTGYKKIISMHANIAHIDASSKKRKKLAFIDDDGVTFKSHIDGSKHRFTPEISMQVQHKIGADIMFAFDELTTIFDSYDYHNKALERTRLWAIRCLKEHIALSNNSKKRNYQYLFGVIQGAQYECLRRKAASDLSKMNIDGKQFDGFGIGGALDKKNLHSIVQWVCQELPKNKPRHLLGISEPDDFFAAIENGIDTFDCVNPSRVARNGAIYSKYGRFNIKRSIFKKDFSPLENGCECYTCISYTKAYVHHLFKAKEIFGLTLATIHNEYYTVNLVNNIRKSIEIGKYFQHKDSVLKDFYA